MMSKTSALIMVDLQNDFCQGGSLAVPDANTIIPLANQLQAHFDLVIATKDWHLPDHISFAANHPDYKVGDVIEVNNLEQILWPIHCVQGAPGAELHPQLETARIQKQFLKGTDKFIDSYSAFFDNAHLRTTGLVDYLLQKKITHLYILGLATDYCVKYSCLDAIHAGFKVHIIEDACRGVELQPGDVQRAMEQMREEGVKIIQSDAILSQ